jgi:two-component system, cell cycle sensor histidine kinase and response regulator CckA
MAAPSRLQPHFPTVLVVDDEQMMRSFLTRIMELEHYQVYAAADGVEALTILENIPPVDLVIADVRMPRMDGRQLAVELSKRHPHTPIVLISGAYLGGGDLLGSVLPKPFTPVALASRVREVLAAQHEQPRDSYSARVLPSERQPPLPPSV